MRKRLSVLVCVLWMMAPLCANAQTPKQAEDFVRGIYAKYNTERGVDTTSKGGGAYFSPSLLDLIRKEERRTKPGDVGVLDFDPICSCQDSDGLSLAWLDVKPGATGTAVAVATLHYPDSSEDIRVELSLKWFREGWRIDEISTKDVPSLRKLLTGEAK